MSVNSQAIPSDSIKFGEIECVPAYCWFLDNISVSTSTAPRLITYDDFKARSFIVPWDLSGDRCALYHNHEKKFGNLSLNITFREDLPQKINIYLVLVYKDDFYIYGPETDRRVTTQPPTKIANRSGVERAVLRKT